MKKDVRDFVSSLNSRKFTNNTQRVLFALLGALKESDDGWISLDKLRVNSAGARVRDLRKSQFGSFDVQCRSASRLDRRGTRHTFYYRLAQRNLSVSKLRKVFM